MKYLDEAFFENFNSKNTSFSINSKTEDFFTVETFPVSKKFNELNINYKDFSDIAKNWINMLKH